MLFEEEKDQIKTTTVFSTEESFDDYEDDDFEDDDFEEDDDDFEEDEEF